MTPFAILDRSPSAATTDPIMFQIFLETYVFLLGFAGLVAVFVLVRALILAMGESRKRAKQMRGEE